MREIKQLAAMPAQRTGAATLVAALGLGLAACSTSPPQPVAMPPAAPVASMAPPAAAAVEELAPGSKAVWALRGGLNVAALLCQNRSLSDDYNRFLKIHRSPLTDAYFAEQARFRQMHGSAGQARHDAAMTKLYNGFASVPDRRRFCTMAVRIAGDLQSLPPADLNRIAPRALSTLEPGAMRLVNSAY